MRSQIVKRSMPKRCASSDTDTPCSCRCKRRASRAHSELRASNTRRSSGLPMRPSWPPGPISANHAADATELAWRTIKSAGGLKAVARRPKLMPPLASDEHRGRRARRADPGLRRRLWALQGAGSFARRPAPQPFYFVRIRKQHRRLQSGRATALKHTHFGVRRPLAEVLAGGRRRCLGAARPVGHDKPRRSCLIRPASASLSVWRAPPTASCAGLS